MQGRKFEKCLCKICFQILIFPRRGHMAEINDNGEK